MNESTIRGVSIRAWLALFTVVTGLVFLYLLAIGALWLLPLDTAVQVVLTIVTAVISFISLALGYYLGQKSAQQQGDEKALTPVVTAHGHTGALDRPCTVCGLPQEYHATLYGQLGEDE